jgi:hypothetical protein
MADGSLPAPAAPDSGPGSYRELDAAEIARTAATLQRRVDERFPGSGLARVGRELHQVCGEAGELAAWLARPHWPLRAGALALGLLFLAGLVGGAARLRLRLNIEGFGELLQALESGVNDVVFVGVGIYFLSTVETRRKRARALRSLHTLRSLAHIIDMHQLTKDPERVIGGAGGADTASSPRRVMSPFELTRYLDYCSEMLALISKAAALHVQRFDDPRTPDAVEQLEDLTNGLSRKIWQKIMILDRVVARG